MLNWGWRKRERRVDREEEDGMRDGEERRGKERSVKQR